MSQSTKNKFETDFLESRDSWWSIQTEIEKYCDPEISHKLLNIMDVCLYNQRDMLIEIDKLKSVIHEQNKPKKQKKLEENKKRKIIFPNNRILEKIDNFLFRLKY